MDEQIRRAIEKVRNTPTPTKEQTAEFYRNLTRIAETKLGRRLTVSEKESLKGMDGSLILYEAMTELFESSTPKALLELLAERGAEGPVGLLRRLASSRRSVQQDWKDVIARSSRTEARVLREFDFNKALTEFSTWLTSLLSRESPPKSIKALCFGLFESKRDWKLYVSGAKAYDQEDSDWACANDWWPEERYAPLNAFSDASRPLRELPGDTWVIGQAIAILLIRGFFHLHRAEVKKLLGNRKLFIASGFDEGDLYAVKTPISPKA